MKMNKFLFSLIIVLAAATTISFANAQEAPPPLEKAATESETPTIPTLGKITIQISQTEQIIIDLPLKTDSKYQVVPIK